MRLHALTGDRTGAVRVYHACASALQRELGMAPSQDTREACERLLAADARPAAKPLPVPSLVGRHAEWGRLQAAWRAVGSGRVGVALLKGEPGIGKTRLAEELLEWAAQQGIANVRTRCFPAEAQLAFAPVTALLRARPLPLLSAGWKREVARLLPELTSGEPGLSPNLVAEPWQRPHLFEILVRVLLTDQPVLILVDDLQWCDADSLEFFHHLTRHDPNARLLLVGTVRPEEVMPAHHLHRVVSSWRHAAVLTEIDLAPLDARATAELAASITGSAPGEAETARLFRETEGNPLFIVEMTRAGLAAKPDGAGGLPPLVQEIIRTRLAHLSPAARDLAGVAAVVGRSFTFGLMAQVTGQEEDALIRQLDEIWQRRIVREHGADAYDFSHDKLREVAYADLGIAKRRHLHLRVAEALERYHEADLDTVSGVIASHYEHAGERQRALAHHRRAAEGARGLFAHDAVITHYGRVADLADGKDRIEALLGIGEAFLCTARLAEAERVFCDALHIADTTEELSFSAEAHMRISEVQRLRGDYHGALSSLEQARSTLARTGEDRRIGSALGAMGRVYYELGEYPQVLTCHEEALTIAERLGDRAAQSQALRDAGNMALVLAEYDRARSWLDRSLSLARDGADRVAETLLTNTQGAIELFTGDLSAALALFTRAADLARQTGHLTNVGLITVNVGYAYEALGDYRSALAHCLEAYKIVAPVGNRRNEALALWHIGIAYGEFGRYTQAQRALLEVLRIAIATAQRAVAAVGIATLGRLAAREGRVEEGLALISRARELLSGIRLDLYVCEFLCWEGELRLDWGQAAEAVRLAEDALQVAMRVKRREVIFAARVLGARAKAAAGFLEAEGAVQDLRSMLGDCPAPRDQAALHYAIWRITGTPAARDAAADLHRTVYDASPCLAFAERCRELGCGDLSPLPPLPDLPEALASRPGDLAALIAAVDRLWPSADVESTPGRQQIGVAIVD